jgi:glycosyltransferase involved in cell wall biosynthesis
MKTSIKLLIVYYNTSIHESLRRVGSGEPIFSSYGFDEYSVDYLLKIREKVQDFVILNSFSLEAYDEVLPCGIRIIGTGYQPYQNKKKLISLLDTFNPTLLIIRTPMLELFNWAVRNKIRTLVCLADSFQNKTIYMRIKNLYMRFLLNSKYIDWVCNHGINSSYLLKRLGVDSKKIVPYDFPHTLDISYEPKNLSDSAKYYHILYVGSISEGKGVGDAIRGIKTLIDEGWNLKFNIAGQGNIEFFSALIQNLKLDSSVTFIGAIPNNEVVALMNKADIVLIPSRCEYPEGLPLTIYEALKSRTPIVASNHPMFQGYLDGSGSVIFTSGNSMELAKAIKKLLTNFELYHYLSCNSINIWNKMQIPTKIGDVIQSWIENSSKNNKWIADCSLTSGKYQLPISFKF